MSSLWDRSGLKPAEFAPDFPDQIVVVCRAPYMNREFLLLIPRAKYEQALAKGELPDGLQALELNATVTLHGPGA